jgi:hypothetical protein
MPRRLPTVAVVCGAALLGWSLGGVASTGRDLQALAPRTATHAHLVADRDHPCHGHRDRPGL